MCKQQTVTQRQRPSRRRGTALLICVFVIAITTVIVVSMLDSQMLQMTALRHTEDYERALYLAGAGAHDALAQIESGSEAFGPFVLGPNEFPAGSGNTYEAKAVEDGADLVITSTGTSGDVSRHLQATVSLN